MSFLNKLKLSETDNIDNLDHPSTSLLHQEIIKKKPLLKKLYIDFYQQFKTALIDIPNPKNIIELGSGGGFLKEIIPNVITSDIIQLPNVDTHFSATDMPFKNNSIDAFFLLDVLHHIPQPKLFFKEADRCLKKRGKIVMIEPANTFFSRLIYMNLLHEDFDISAEWEFNTQGPLSSANAALAWIIFARDLKKFKKMFPSLKIKTMRQHTPFRYLFSGGLSYKQFVPSCCYVPIHFIEKFLSPFNKYIGLFMTIEIQKN